MKLKKSILTLTAAALLPAFAYADTDAVAASFERDMYRGQVDSAVVVTGKPDPFMVEFNAALHGTTDPVLASFERDMYREPASSTIAAAEQVDTLTIEFYAALRDVLDKPAVHANAVGNDLSGS